MKKKICAKCKLSKPISEFTKLKYNLRKLCKECYNAQTREYYKNNKKKRSIKIKQYQCSESGRYIRGKAAAKTRCIQWDITLSEFSSLIKESCYYCNNKFGKPTENGHGLDRLDNTVGYIIGNVVTCCWHCNKIKCDLISPNEMKQIINLLINLRQ